MADDTYDVFVSYSRADGRHAAEIDSVLRDKGLNTFFDRSNLAAGLPWVRALALERLAADWIALAEQVERIDREKFPLRDEEICDFADRGPKSVRSEPLELC